MRKLGFNIRMSFSVVFILTLLLVSPSVKGTSCKRGCLNGGVMFLPNNIFGYCRCVCKAPFLGPRCQIVNRKRSQTSQTLEMLFSGRPVDFEEDAIEDKEN